MRNTKILSMFLSSIMVVGGFQLTFAAMTATQNLSAGLASVKTVVPNGGNLTAVIDPSAGSINMDLNPGFEIKTNVSSSQNLDLAASCDGQTTQNAIYDRGGQRYIILTNSVVPPSDSAINNCKQPAPVPSQNPNAISYVVAEPSSIPGQLNYNYNPGGAYWNADLTHKGSTYTDLKIPVGGPYSGTFSDADLSGSYSAAITLSFNP